MFIVRLRGGLGNQLFQYAFSEYLKRYSDEVYIDKSEFNVFQCHDGLEVEKIFDLSVKGARSIDIIKHANYIPIPIGGRLGFYLFQHMLSYEEKKISTCKKDSHILESQIRNMSDDQLEKYLTNNRENTLYFDGYWLGSRYINKLGDDWIRFRSDYTRKYRSYLDGIDFDHMCSVHVRKGDYTGSPLDICNEAYYQKAINHIITIDPQMQFLVFSDEPDKARMIVGEDNSIRYIDTRGEKTAGVDIWLMSLCRHNIIANSTYSYWGSRLNRHKDKVVVMPEQYAEMKYGNTMLI